MLKKNSIAGAAAVMAASGVTMQVIGFFYRVLLTRFLGAEGMGVYALVFPVYGIIVSVSLAGLSVAVGNISAGLAATGHGGQIKRLVLTAAAAFVCLFTALAVPTAVFHREIAQYILGDERAGTALLLFLPCILLTGIENICKAVFYGVRKVSVPVASEISEQLLRIGAVAALLSLMKPSGSGEAVTLVVLGMTISEVFSSTFMALQCRALLRKYGRSADAPAARELLSMAIPVSLGALGNNLIGSANTVLLPDRLSSGGMTRADATKALGVVSGMTTPLAALPLALVSALSSVVSPKIAELKALGRGAEIRRKISRSFESTGMIILPTLALLWPLSPILCRLLFNQPVGEVYMALLIASVAAGAYQTITVGILNGLGRARRAMAQVVAGGIVHLALMYFLAARPSLLIYGFFIADTVGTLATVGLNLGVIRRETGVRIGFCRAIAAPVCVAALTAAMSRGVALACSALDPAVALTFSAAAGTLMYGSAFLAFRLARERAKK